MLQLHAQWDAGYKTAKARRNNDAGLANHLAKWSSAAVRMSDDPNAERAAYDEGYRAYHSGDYTNPHK